MDRLENPRRVDLRPANDHDIRMGREVALRDTVKVVDEDPTPYRRLNALLQEAKEPWWPPPLIERWPVLFALAVLVGWVIVLGVMAANGPYVKLSLIGLWVIASGLLKLSAKVREVRA